MSELGNCYKSAANTLMAHKKLGVAGLPYDEDVFLVHGRPKLTKPPFCEYGHAWLEWGDVVLDTETDNIIPRQLFYSVGNIDEDTCVRYTYKMAQWFMLEYSHYGPWEGIESCPPYGQELTLQHIVSVPINKPQLVILRGLPGSGKTHSLHAIKHRSPVVCSPDKFLSPLIRGNYSERRYIANKKCFDEFRPHLKRKAPLIVIDKANISCREFLPYVDRGIAAGYHVHIVEVLAPCDWCVKHNKRKLTEEKLIHLNERWDTVPRNLRRWVKTIEKGV